MKNHLLLIISCFLIAGIFTGCQKGKDLVSPGYGQLSIISSFSADADPLLVEIDGKTSDTLKISKQSINLPIKEGQRHVVFINQNTKQIITDTTVTIKTQKIFTLPTFLYTGAAALFDDVVAKPAIDSMLVRFVITDPSLPKIMNIEISLYDLASTVIPLTNKKLNGINKAQFSNFIQLPNPSLIAGPDASLAYYYVIEGFDPADNNKKVMSISDFTFSYTFDFDINASFSPNIVLSMGIGPAPAGTHDPVTIFRRSIN